MTTATMKRSRRAGVEAAAAEMAERRRAPLVANGDTPPCLTSTSTPAGFAFQSRATPPPDQDGELRPLMPLQKLIPSPTNPRKHFDEDGLAELAESMRSVGVAVPLLVRPAPPSLLRAEKLPLDAEAYEIVDGERRYRAAKLAELRTLECKIRALSDLQVIEIQLISTLQRAGLKPLEEAAGYRRLLDDHGFTVEDVARKVGKAKTYVYGVLKLAELPKEAKKAMEEGRLPKATAELIARIPNGDLRAKAAAEVLAGDYDSKPDPMPFRSAKEWISQQYMVELKSAPFNRKDAELLPEAGPCSACPKLTGNNRELYPDGRADVCTDPGCYQRKLAAHHQRMRKRVEEEGIKLLSDSESSKLFPYNGTTLAHGSPYVDLKEQCWEDRQGRSWKELVEPHIAKGDLVAAQDKVGEIHLLAPGKVAAELARKHHKIGVDSRGPARNQWATSAAEKKRRAKEAKENRVKNEVSRRLIAQVVEKAERLASGWTGLDANFLRCLAVGACDEVWAVISNHVLKRRGLEGKTHTSRQTAIKKHIAGLSAAQCIGFMAELVATRNNTSQFPADRSTGKSLLEGLGIDGKKIEREVRAGKSAAVSPARGKSARAKLRKAHPEIDWEHSDVEDDA